MISLPALEALAANTYPALVRLSPDSLTLIYSLYQYCALYNWSGAGYELTPAEIDRIDAIVGKLYDEVMHPVIGTIIPTVLATLPDYMLPCDGSLHSSTDYPELYAVIDDAYKDGLGGFFTPDLRDKFPLGAGTAFAVNASGGNVEQSLTIAQLPAHTHTTQPHSHTDLGHIHATEISIATIDDVSPGVPVPGSLPGTGFTASASANIQSSVVTVDNTGDGEPVPTMPPYTAIKYAMVAK